MHFFKGKRITQYSKFLIFFFSFSLKLLLLVLPRLQKKKKFQPVDFDGELKTGDVRYDNLTKIN